MQQAVVGLKFFSAVEVELPHPIDTVHSTVSNLPSWDCDTCMEHQSDMLSLVLPQSFNVFSSHILFQITVYLALNLLTPVPSALRIDMYS